MKKIWTMLTILIVLAIVVPATMAVADNPNPGVLPPQSSPYGKTYGEWSADWWNWALGQPVATNPLLDQTGANCSVDQEGPVWFLAGVFGVGSASRTCTIPAGKALFFPIANAFCAQEGDGSDEYQIECAADAIDPVTDLSAEVDGVSIQDLQAYRAASPIFALTLPEDNLFGVPAGVYSPAAADGYYLMLAPLPAGPHTIHFHALFPGGVLDVTYHLTIGSLP